MYDVTNNYWAGAPGIYSTAFSALITEPDATYDAWKEAGGLTTPWPRDLSGQVTTAALDELLIAAGLRPTGLTAPSKGQLLIYSNAKVMALIAAPTPFVLSSGVTVTNDSTGQTANNLSGLLLGPAAMADDEMTQWTDDIGVVSPLTKTLVGALAIAVTARVKAIYVQLALAASGIGDGSITTTAQIDALTWPT